MTDLVKTTFSGGPSGDWLSQFHIDRLLGGGVQDSIDIVRDFWNALSGVISSSVTYHIDGAVEIVDPVTGKPTGIDQGTTRTNVFTAPTDSLPWQTQALIYWNTGSWIGGRQVRGRTFIPGMVEMNNNGDGSMGSSLLTTLGTAATVLSNATTCTPGIYSRKHTNTYPIVSHTVIGHWSVMRTRR